MKNKFIKIAIILWGIIVVIGIIYAFALNISETEKQGIKVEEETHWIKGKGVRLREEPSLTSKIITTLRGGNGVIILDRIEPEILIANQKGRWAKVKVLTGKSKEKIGFVFDVFLVDVVEIEKLIAKAKGLEATELGSAIQIYETILQDFPSSGRNADDNESNGRLNLQTTILKCWNEKKHPGFATKELILEEIKKQTLEANREKLKDIADCQFLLWDNPCAGDPYPQPTGDEQISEYLKWTTDFNWSIVKDNCIESNDKKNHFCFYLYENKGIFFWSGGCYNDYRFKPNEK